MTTPSSSSSTLSPLRVAVTGGTSGLGLALVRALHARGAQVAFVARDARRVQRVADELPGTHGIVGDIADKLDTHRLALQINAALGGLDVLVNNAATNPYAGPLIDADVGRFDKTVQINLRAGLTFATAAALVWAAGRVFRVGLLMQGKTATFGQMVRWLSA